MSAAEKLRALDEAILRDKDYQDESIVLAALPQIVAVVQYAEAAERVFRERGGTPDELTHVLAALDEALS